MKTLLLFGFLTALPLLATEYHWRNVPIGGGGYVTGLLVHPRDPALVYIRTDVGGAYRWTETKAANGQRWLPLVDFVSPETKDLASIDGFALDPTDPEVVYVCAGNGNAAISDVLKSTDRGETWQRTHLDKLFHGNGPARWCGERIAVDPFDGRRLLVGTRRDGLWLNAAGGKAGAWIRVESFSAGANHVPVVLFDPAVRNRVYAGIANGGFQRSDDGGKSWRALGGVRDVSRAALGAGGKLYVSGKEGVFLYDPASETWADISPRVGANSWCAIAVAPSDPQIVLAAEYFYGFNTPFWLSRDGGRTWAELTLANGRLRAKADVPWHRDQWFAAATSNITFDPTDANRVWFTDWYATWRTDNLLAPVAEWRTYEPGHEELVGLSLGVPYAGAGPLLYSGHADVGGFVHRSLTDYPEKSMQLIADDGLELLKELTGIASSACHPAAAAFIGADGWDDKRSETQKGGLYTSNDGGRTLTRMPGYAETWKWGRVAMSAGDPRNLVVATRGGTYASLDGGTSFQRAIGLPEGGKPFGIQGHIFNRMHPLASDAAKSGVFYLFAAPDGTFYRSEDGGRTWQPGGKLPAAQHEMIDPSALKGKRAVFVQAAPGRAGQVWVADAQSGLFRSTDGGDAFSRIDGIHQILGFSIGAPRGSNDHPALYLFGVVGEEPEAWLWRSDDGGSSWAKINDERHRLGSTLLIAADPSHYGRIYIATGGRGVIVGEPTEPVKP